MDVDRFKAYNDAFGHQQGDIALKELARSFKHILQRSSDFVGRWGGEEFVALLPNTNADGALEVAEKVRQFVEKMEIPSIEDAAAHITVSIGVNTREYGNTKAKIQDFFEGADKALYAAKSAGRNKVCHYSHVL
jgi:diguanylate cyclase (GGDEF)-like protein